MRATRRSSRATISTNMPMATWFARTEIPSDQASAGVGYDVYNLTQRQLRDVVAGAPATSQVGGLYQSFMDEARVDALGAKPLMADHRSVLPRSRIKAEMARFMGATQGTFGATVVERQPYADTADPTVNVLWMGQGGFGPARTRLLSGLTGFKPQRDAYRAYIARTLKMTGSTPTRARPPPTRSWRSKPTLPKSAGRSPTAATSARSTIRCRRLSSPLTHRGSTGARGLRALALIRKSVSSSTKRRRSATSRRFMRRRRSTR